GPGRTLSLSLIGSSDRPGGGVYYHTRRRGVCTPRRPVDQTNQTRPWSRNFAIASCLASSIALLTTDVEREVPRMLLTSCLVRCSLYSSTKAWRSVSSSRASRAFTAW